MGVEKRIASVLVDDILEVFDEVAIPRCDGSSRRVQNAASVTHRVVVARGPLVGCRVQQNELVPLADDHPVGGTAGGTRRQLEPLISGAARVPITRPNVVDRRRQRHTTAERQRPIAAVDERRQPSELQMVLK